MNKFKGLTFDDFIYKGKKLSSFDGYVGSVDDGLKTYSVLPSRSYVTDKPLGSNITTVYDSSLEPRTFEVPIVFNELTDGKLREIAMWLDSPIDSQFQWVDDDVYINACLDSTDFNAQSSSGVDGQIALKFICHDPFYYSTKLTQYTIASPVSGRLYTYANNGYGDLPPKLTVSCSGTIKIEILDSNKEVYTTTNITDITAGVKINSETLECTLLSGASHFAHIDDFPMIPQGEFSLKITGSSLTNAVLEYRERYI